MSQFHKNENGAALVIVLLIITVIGIITPPIISNILGSIEQYQRTEESVQRSKLEDMGLTYMENAIIQSEEVASGEIETWLGNLDSAPNHHVIVRQFKNSLENEFRKNGLIDGVEISMTDQIRYRISISDIKIANGQNIVVNYAVAPTINGDYRSNHLVEEMKTIQVAIEDEAS
ncbi:hypothetical protein [Allobacillus halotolerans]|uniref:Type II secretion system protein n=1 Tax=Allobacillus halotolerans TaxID=570278 RepID=A0ABS6GR53_9BACI|nr:hypothetical protein [Allobacillus halotolerans]MBU6081591.1 hypothetical protein [Allobacillus halotolerans]